MKRIIEVLMTKTFQLRVSSPLVAMGLLLAAPLAQAANPAETATTATPIKHVIVVIGENHTFDNLFATYQPAGAGQFVSNLLSRGIVNSDGTPGPAFMRAAQFTVAPQSAYYVSAPLSAKTPYSTLPAPDLAGVPSQASNSAGPPFAAAAFGAAAEPFLESQDLALLTTGASGLPAGAGNPDSRIANVTKLPNGPFQLTAKNAAGQGLPYDSYVSDQVHRFYQMWQQFDCNASFRTRQNPSGCLADLLPFVATTFEAASQAGQWGQALNMGFYNMLQGDAPYLKSLADQYAIADNYHQAVMGGTGANHVMMQTGDMMFWSDGAGHPQPAPTFPGSLFGLPASLTLSPVANPNPIPGTNNMYAGDLLGAFGVLTNCSDNNQPGVLQVQNYLGSLPYQPRAVCAANTFYVINNVCPYFHANGAPGNPASPNPSPDGCDISFIPPQTIPTVGDAMAAKNISWVYYGDGYNHWLAGDPFEVAYCPICNAEQYSINYGSPAFRTAHTKDATDLATDIANGNVPSVAFLKPSGLVDGHPQSSKVDLFEAFVRSLVDKVQAQPALWAETAILVTFDEGGGGYDSGFLQPVDFFGDGPRVPLLVISPLAKGGKVVHTYYDHVSILKFIEHNWGLSPLSTRSRDNLPNPVQMPGNPYVPVNMPAIGDLFDFFTN